MWWLLAGGGGDRDRRSKVVHGREDSAGGVWQGWATGWRRGGWDGAEMEQRRVGRCSRIRFRLGEDGGEERGDDSSGDFRNRFGPSR